MDKIIFAKNAQVLNVERAKFAYDTLVEHYPKVFGKNYTPSAKGKLAKVETDAKSQKWAKEQIRLAL